MSAWSLGRIFRGNGEQESHGNDGHEQAGEDEAREAEEPRETELTAPQLEAIETAEIRAQAILREIDDLKAIRRRQGSRTGVTIADARRIKDYSGYVKALESDDPAKKVEAAIRVLSDCGEEALAKLENARRRLDGISVKHPRAGETIEMTTGTAETIESVGKEIEDLEMDIGNFKRSINVLAGRA